MLDFAAEEYVNGAYAVILQNGLSGEFAGLVRSCISLLRRIGEVPGGIENEKDLFLNKRAVLGWLRFVHGASWWIDDGTGQLERLENEVRYLGYRIMMDRGKWPKLMIPPNHWVELGKQKMTLNTLKNATAFTKFIEHVDSHCVPLNITSDFGRALMSYFLWTTNVNNIRKGHECLYCECTDCPCNR